MVSKINGVGACLAPSIIEGRPMSYYAGIGVSLEASHILRCWRDGTDCSGSEGCEIDRPRPVTEDRRLHFAYVESPSLCTVSDCDWLLTRVHVRDFSNQSRCDPDSGMFIDSVPNRGSPPAILLRENYRDENGRTQKRTLANLSKPACEHGRGAESDPEGR
jgi:hypothetical protein